MGLYTIGYENLNKKRFMYFKTIFLTFIWAGGNIARTSAKTAWRLERILWCITLIRSFGVFPGICRNGTLLRV